MSGVVTLVYNQVCCQILSKVNYVRPKKFYGGHKNFLKVKSHKIFKIYIKYNFFFFPNQGVPCLQCGAAPINKG